MIKRALPHLLEHSQAPVLMRVLVPLAVCLVGLDEH